MSSIGQLWSRRRPWSSLRSASYWAQLSVIAGCYVAFYVALFVAICTLTNWQVDEGLSMPARVAKAATFLFLEGTKAPEIRPIWGLVNKLGLLLLTAFSSSLFTSKMIARQSKLRFSKELVRYSRSIIESERSEFSRDCLVLRLLNENVDDLYNVRISATLRYYDLKTETFQHYKCRVINQNIPVLGYHMPFRIYIEMGEIVSAIYKRELSFFDTGDTDISIEEIHREIEQKLRPSDADQMIIYLEGIDSGEGKQSTASHRYAIRTVREGKFESIQPLADGTGFAEVDIKRCFDNVIALPAREQPIELAQSTAATAEPPRAQ